MGLGLLHGFRVRDLLLGAVDDDPGHHAGTQPLAGAHGQQRGGLHFEVHYAHLLPLFHRATEATGYATREGIVALLARVEGVRRGGDADMRRGADSLGGFD